MPRYQAEVPVTVTYVVSVEVNADDEDEARVLLQELAEEQWEDAIEWDFVSADRYGWEVLLA